MSERSKGTLRNLALHATLEIKMITVINNASQKLVKLEQPTKEKMKLRGTTGNGIDVYIDMELVGSPMDLEQFRFEVGHHLGMVLRLID